MQTAASGSDAKSANPVAKWWHNWKSRRAAANELQACGTDEVAQLARDVGVSPAELCTLAGKGSDIADLLPQRIAAIGLDAQRITATEPQVMRDLERVCSQCEEHGRCARELAHDRKSWEWRTYCPNVATFDALRTEDRDHRLMRRRKWRAF